MSQEPCLLKEGVTGRACLRPPTHDNYQPLTIEEVVA